MTSLGAEPSGLAVLDVDGDADLDVVVASGGVDLSFRRIAIPPEPA
ncbi:MAG: hypothetical protein U0X73_07960 [Thermoanaerobaculia bacterium]